MNQRCEESMKSSKKVDGKFCADSSALFALLIGRNSCSELTSYVGGVTEEKYTTPDDIALR